MPKTSHRTDSFIEKVRAKGLTPKQELFCQFFVSEEFFANGTRSYCKAYGLDYSDKKDQNAAAVHASEYLRDRKVLKRIDELLDLGGLNDQFVDKQLLFLISQSDDLHAKTAAIREYNALKARIQNKLDITSKGEQISIQVVDFSKIKE